MTLVHPQTGHNPREHVPGTMGATSRGAGAAKVYVCFRMIRLEVEAFERHKGINLVRRGAAKS